MDIDMQKLQILLKTIECGSLTKAAERTNYTQPGVTRIIQELERDWGVSLLERDRSGIRVTSNGRDLLPSIQRTYLECAALKTHIDSLNNLTTGLLRIGCFASAAIHWLPNILKRYQADFPGVDFEVTIENYQNLEQMILKGDLDGSFLPLPPLQRMDSIHLGSDQFYVVLPEGHPLSAYEKVPTALLQDYPFFMLKSGVNTEVERYFEENDLHVKTQYTLWDDFITMAMVEKGIGIAMMSGTILKHTPFHLVIREPEVPLTRELGFVLRSRETCSVAMKRFLEYLPYGLEPSP